MYIVKDNSKDMFICVSIITSLSDAAKKELPSIKLNALKKLVSKQLS